MSAIKTRSLINVVDDTGRTGSSISILWTQGWHIVLQTQVETKVLKSKIKSRLMYSGSVLFPWEHKIHHKIRHHDYFHSVLKSCYLASLSIGLKKYREGKGDDSELMSESKGTQHQLTVPRLPRRGFQGIMDESFLLGIRWRYIVLSNPWHQPWLLRAIY